jgi:hypothetical protein
VKSPRLSSDDYLIVFPDGWPVNLEEVFGMNADQLYEENLRACRTHGHELEGGIMADGREWMKCARCGIHFTEDEL